jgi:20S proteasome subunit beta 6
MLTTQEQFYVSLNINIKIAIAGKDFVVVAGDKRLSLGYTILSRDSSKLCKLTDKVILASSGMYADIIALQKNLKARIEIYRSTHKRDPSLSAIAQMLSTTLYSRRFFPFYAFNILSGVRDDGVFTNYGYDAVGSFDESLYGAQGSGNELITPVLDNIMKRNPNLSEGEAINLIKETMNGCSCRDIYTGDKLEITILRADGTSDTFEENLRKD